MLSFFCIVIFTACGRHGSNKEEYTEEKAKAPFTSRVSLGTIAESELDEISGIVASQRYPGCYWVHNDSGGSPSIYLIDSLARLLAEVRLEGVANRDWEDIALGPSPNGDYSIYIADIGDNREVYGDYYIYKIDEPNLAAEDAMQFVATDDFSILQFQYPDGARDAETLLIDPNNSDILIVSKRGDNVVLYHWPVDQQTSEPFVLTRAGDLPFWMIVAGDISADGQELLLKNYESVFYWKKEKATSWLEAIKTNPHRLPYQPEPQGEAIAFTRSGDGYVTLSEGKGFNDTPHLYFYRRKREE